MRICYVANNRFPSERAHMTQIVEMCNAFAHRGHEVTLLVTDRPTLIEEDPEEFYGVKFLFRVIRISVLDVAGRSVFIPNIMRPGLFMLQRLMYSVQAAVTVQRSHVDLVYGRDEWVLALLSFFTSARIVWESHEARFTCATRILVWRGIRFVVISEGIRDEYIRKGLSEETVFVAHDAVDDRFFAPHISQLQARHELGITSSVPVVMYIGEFDEWKGVHTLFEAARDQKIFSVHVIGGRDSNELEYLRTIHPEVKFLGPRPYRNLPQNQQAADVLIIPNTAKNKLSSDYTSPLKLFAHMTSLKPIVCTRIRSIENVVSDSDVWFVKPDDPKSLREGIMNALADPESSNHKARHCYEKSKKYTWKIRANIISERMFKC